MRSLVIWILCVSSAFAIDEAELREIIANGDHGQVVQLDDKPITLTSPLIIDNRAWFRMTGIGSERPRIRYTGPPDQRAIILRDCYQSELGNFWIEGNCEAAISIETTADGQWPISSENYVHDIFCQRTSIGVYIDSHAHDQNNEFHRIENVKANRCDIGFKVWGTQAHRIQFDGCTTTSCRIGLQGEHGNYWSWRNGQATANELDFQVRSFVIQAVIDGHRTESSKQFFLGGGQGTYNPISIRNVSWDGLPDDGSPVIDSGSRGPIVIENAIFSSPRGKALRLVFRGVDSLHASGVVVDYGNPEDVSQRPVYVPHTAHVSGGPVMQRLRHTRSEWEHENIFIRPEPDLSRGIVDDWAESHTTLRSFTVAAKVLMPRPSGERMYPLIGGFRVRLQGVDRLHVRGVKPVISHAVSGYQTGETYPFVLSYDRDYPDGLVTVRLGEHLAGGDELISGGRVLGNLPTPEDAGIDWNGLEVEDVRIWDRVLTLEEIWQVQ